MGTRRLWSRRVVCALPLMLSAVCACSSPGADDPLATAPPLRAQEAASQLGLGARPRIIARGAITGQSLLELYLPQPAGGLLVGTDCPAATLQRLFGVASVEQADLLTPSEAAALSVLDRPTWTFPCSPELPKQVQYLSASSTWLVQVPQAAASSDADAGAAADLVLAIPQRCVQLIAHFRVDQRARAQRGEATLPALTANAVLSCDSRPPIQVDGGWSADVVFAGRRQRPLVVLSRGESRLYLHRVDARAPSASSQEDNREALAALGALFQIPPERRTTSFKAVQTPAFAYHVCTQGCERFMPSHLQAQAGELVCSDRSVPDAQGTCPASAPRFVLRARLADDGAEVLDFVRADDPSQRGATFATCSGDARWERTLGLTVQPTTLDFVDEARERYLTPDPAVTTPCVRETGCSVDVATNLDNQDLSAPALLRAIDRACWQGEDVLTLRLRGRATAGATLNLRAPPLASSTLPRSINTVRLVAASERASIEAQTRLCGTAPCPNEFAVISVSGSLRLEVEGVQLVATPAPRPPPPPGQPQQAAPALPGNRLAFEVKEGASLVLRGVDVGAAVGADEPAPHQFFTGIRATDASVYAVHSSVRAFATALDAKSTRVVVASSPLRDPRSELSVLGGERSYQDLLGLSGRPLAQVTAYAAARLSGSRTRAFIAGVQLLGPAGLVYVGPGTGQADVLVMDTLLHWLPEDCASKVFQIESRALELSGTGELLLKGVDVQGMGSLLRCQPSASVSAVFSDHSTFDRILQRLDPGSCRVRTEFNVAPSTCAI